MKRIRDLGRIVRAEPVATRIPGIFFLHPRGDASPDGDQSAAIRASVYGHLRSKRIVFKCPAVPPGEYRIAVRMRRKSGAIEEGVGALAVEVGSRSTA